MTDEIDKKFRSLPEEIQNIIYSPETANSVQSIGEKYNLHIDKMDKLILATEDVMAGDVSSEEFISHIKKELEIDQETANKIGQEINQQVFESIRDAIKSLSNKTEVEEEPDITPVVVSDLPKPTIADIKTKEKTSSPVQENNYTLDPYREPIE